MSTDTGYNAGLCRNAMEQGYATLAHKMNCNLPHSGQSLWPWALVGGIAFLIGLLMLVANSRGWFGR